jgi:hypothetical protein
VLHILSYTLTYSTAAELPLEQSVKASIHIVETDSSTSENYLSDIEYISLM